MIQAAATEGLTRFKVISPVGTPRCNRCLEPFVCTKQDSHLIWLIPGSPHHMCTIDSAVSHSAITTPTQIMVWLSSRNESSIDSVYIRVKFMSTAVIQPTVPINLECGQTNQLEEDDSHTVLRPNLSILSSSSCRLVWNFALTVLAW